MILSDASRPRLSAKARLMRDRRGGEPMLLYPERGLVLNETAAAIIALCNGERTVADILAAVGEAYVGAPASMVAEQTRAFLYELADRGLLADKAVK